MKKTHVVTLLFLIQITTSMCCMEHLLEDEDLGKLFGISRKLPSTQELAAMKESLLCDQTRVRESQQKLSDLCKMNRRLNITDKDTELQEKIADAEENLDHIAVALKAIDDLSEITKNK